MKTKLQPQHNEPINEDFIDGRVRPDLGCEQPPATDEAWVNQILKYVWLQDVEGKIELLHNPEKINEVVKSAVTKVYEWWRKRMCEASDELDAEREKVRRAAEIVYKFHQSDCICEWCTLAKDGENE